MKKNIWIFHHYASAPNDGGLVRPYDFSKNLIEKGYCPVIFASSFNHYTKKNIDTKNHDFLEQTEENIPFVYIKNPEYGTNGLDRVRNILSYFIKLFKVTRKYAKKIQIKPDIIIASSAHPLTCVAGIFIAKRYKIPCIAEIRDLWPESIFVYSKKITEKSFIGRILLLIEKWIYKNAHKIIFTKEGDIDYIYEKKWDKKSGGPVDTDKCVYINNGVDIVKFYRQKSENKIDDIDLDTDKFNVVYTGAIRAVNDVSKILDVAKILEKHTDIQFLIYGTGNEEQMIINRIEDEKILNVKFKGFVKKENIPYILGKSDLNILQYSSDKYNWSRGNSSNKLFEYMASGKPVLATFKMGYCIIEKNNIGITCQNNNADTIAKNILKIKNLDKKTYEKMCENAILTVKDYDFKTLTHKLINTIEKI